MFLIQLDAIKMQIWNGIGFFILIVSISVWSVYHCIIIVCCPNINLEKDMYINSIMGIMLNYTIYILEKDLILGLIMLFLLIFVWYKKNLEETCAD